MSRETEHLAESERHIAEFRKRIADQEARIAELRRDGHSTEAAESLLRGFRETLRLGENHRELILREIDRMSGRD